MRAKPSSAFVATRGHRASMLQSRPGRRSALALAATLCLAAAGTAPAAAATLTWDGGGPSGDWNSLNTTLGPNLGATNWNGAFSVPGNGDSLIFAGSTRRSNTNTHLDSIVNLSFAAGAGAFTLGGDRLKVTGDLGNLSNNVQTINLPITVGATRRTWDGGTQGINLNGAFVLGNNSLTLNNKIALNNGSSDFIVGDGGSAQLTLASGSGATHGTGYLGRNTGDVVGVSVGAGSYWISSVGLNLGSAASGGRGALGAFTGGEVTAGYLNVRSPGSTLREDGGSIRVIGNLALTDGGQAQSNRSFVDSVVPTDPLGIHAGNAIISGTGSLWDTGTHYSGYGGVGTTTVASGGVLQTRNGMHAGYLAQSSGVLNVNAGGVVNTGGSGSLGHVTGASGAALVRGTGARWDVAGDLFVGGSSAGSGGTGKLTVDSEGKLTARNLWVWNGNSSITTGTTATSNSGVIDIGGVLALSGGGKAASQRGVVDSSPAARSSAFDSSIYAGIASLSGTGSRWDAETLWVGRTGAGTVTVSDGAAVKTVRDGFLGYLSGATGTVTVGGAGARWDVTGGLFVGGSDTAPGGTGSLAVNSGGTVTAGSLKAWSGSVLAGTATTFTGGVVGVAGTLTLTGSATATSTSGFVGFNATPVSGIYAGNAVIGGPGSSGARWDTRTHITGHTGTGTTTVAAGGMLSSTSDTLVGGTNSQSKGTLNVLAGGNVQTGGDGYLAYAPGSTGAVSVGGSGARWDVAGRLFVGGNYAGSGGSGTLSVIGGGTVTAAALTVWNEQSHITVPAPTEGSRLSVTGPLLLNAGATAVSPLSVVDDGPRDYGSLKAFSATITGLGSRWIAGQLFIGFDRTGVTTVADGGELISSLGTYVGFFSGSTGTLNVLDGTVSTSGYAEIASSYLGSTGSATIDGANARWRVGERLQVGALGTGTLTVQNGGLVSVGAGLEMGSGGTLTLNNGGSISAGVVVVRNRGAVVTTGATQIQGDLINESGGRITVDGLTSLRGNIVHDGASFELRSGARAYIDPNGSLSGAGRYTGPGELVVAGSLRPGNSTALMSVEGNLTLQSTSSTVLELGGRTRGSQYDAIDVGGTLSLDGSLNVVFHDLGGGVFTPAAGDSFDLFKAEAIDGRFSGYGLAALAPGLVWDIAYLPDAVGTTDVVRLTVSAVPEVETYLMMLAGLGVLGFLSRRQLHSGA